MELEEKVMKNNVFYFHIVENENSCLKVKFLGDPEKPDIVRILTFSNIQDYREEWYDKDETCIEMLIGLHEEPKEKGVDYMFHTDQREIFFYTETEPQIKDVKPSSPSQITD